MNAAHMRQPSYSMPVNVQVTQNTLIMNNTDASQPPGMIQ